jgi:hypothetical protein
MLLIELNQDGTFGSYEVTTPRSERVLHDRPALAE